MKTRLLSRSTSPKVTWGMGFDDCMWQARRAQNAMPTARLGAQCTDFKTNLGPLQKPWGCRPSVATPAAAPLCGWSCISRPCSVASWCPATAFTVSQNPKWFHCFPFPPPVDIGFSSCSYQAKPPLPTPPWNYTLKKVGKVLSVLYVWTGLCFLMFLQVLMKMSSRGRIIRINSMHEFTVSAFFF